MTTQALVVGAGPVGLTMAAELARYGVGVRIVDKAAQRTDKSKALVVWSRTLELLARAGCADRFVAAGNQGVAANIVAGGELIGHISLTGIDSPYPYGLVLPQSDTERLLEEHLQSLGVRVERLTELTDFREAGGLVSAVLQRTNGDTERLEVQWLLGCDGAHSTVRHKLGLAFEGDTLQSDWILADVHLSGVPYPSSELAMYWHADGALALFPISGDRYRVVADLGRAQGPLPHNPTLQDAQAVIARRGPGGMVASNPIWLAGFRINERKVHDYRAGRVFVAGDAAHVHSPAGGQGMNTGMQDAFNLAWKLALACDGTCDTERLLASYSAERGFVGEQVLQDAGRLTALAVMKNSAAQTIRNALGTVLFGLSPVRRAMAEKLTEVSIGYPHSPLNGAHTHGLRGPAPGERVIPVAGQQPVGAGGVPRFALFAKPDEGIQRVLREHPNLLEPEARPPLHDGGIWLVRPDGYAAVAVKEGHSDAVDSYLKSYRVR